MSSSQALSDSADTTDQFDAMVVAQTSTTVEAGPSSSHGSQLVHLSEHQIDPRTPSDNVWQLFREADDPNSVVNDRGAQNLNYADEAKYVNKSRGKGKKKEVEHTEDEDDPPRRPRPLPVPPRRRYIQAPRPLTFLEATVELRRLIPGVDFSKLTPTEQLNHIARQTFVDPRERPLLLEAANEPGSLWAMYHLFHISRTQQFTGIGRIIGHILAQIEDYLRQVRGPLPREHYDTPFRLYAGMNFSKILNRRTARYLVAHIEPRFYEAIYLSELDGSEHDHARMKVINRELSLAQDGLQDAGYGPLLKEIDTAQISDQSRQWAGLMRAARARGVTVRLEEIQDGESGIWQSFESSLDSEAETEKAKSDTTLADDSETLDVRREFIGLGVSTISLYEEDTTLRGTSTQQNAEGLVDVTGSSMKVDKGKGRATAADDDETAQSATEHHLRSHYPEDEDHNGAPFEPFPIWISHNVPAPLQNQGGSSLFAKDFKENMTASTNSTTDGTPQSRRFSQQPSNIGSTEDNDTEVRIERANRDPRDRPTYLGQADAPGNAWIFYHLIMLSRYQPPTAASSLLSEILIHVYPIVNPAIVQPGSLIETNFEEILTREEARYIVANMEPRLYNAIYPREASTPEDLDAIMGRHAYSMTQATFRLRAKGLGNMIAFLVQERQANPEAWSQIELVTDWMEARMRGDLEELKAARLSSRDAGSLEDSEEDTEDCEDSEEYEDYEDEDHPAAADDKSQCTRQ